MAKAKQRYPALDKLKGRMKENRVTYRQLAEDACMSLSTLCFKINGQRAFATDEIEQICKILRIPTEEIAEYFLPRLLTKIRKTA